ncbi:MAG: hypothetical protein U0M02_07045 [Acutalibacteraceae bacterium]|nr:hypothetical protein [Acutalibacteraceae bacterium]
MKKTIKAIMMIVGFIGLLICGIWATVLHFQNPDMTELRFFLEFPQVTIIGVICAIVEFVGMEI